MDGCAPAWGRDVAAMGKRLGEEWFFSEAFDIFRHISTIFRVLCLVVLGNFVYLHTVKGVDANSPPELINSKEI